MENEKSNPNAPEVPEDLDAFLESFNASLENTDDEDDAEEAVTSDDTEEEAKAEEEESAKAPPSEDIETRRARALKKLGYTDDDLDAILADEPAEKKTEDDTEVRFEAMLTSDLAIIRAGRPNTAPTSLHELKDLKEYVRRRALGADPVTAFDAVAGEEPAAPPRSDNKAHLIPSAPTARRAAPPSEIPPDVYRQMQELYPTASKKDLQKLYARTRTS